MSPKKTILLTFPRGERGEGPAHHMAPSPCNASLCRAWIQLPREGNLLKANQEPHVVTRAGCQTPKTTCNESQYTITKHSGLVHDAASSSFVAVGVLGVLIVMQSAINHPALVQVTL